MAKKNKKRPRKRKPLKADPKRQAHASIKGYHYQILHSVEAWLGLAKDEILYLEGAEDFDKVSGDAATATQVKHTRGNITLRSQQVIDGINNYWELRTNNPDRRVKFRLLTKSKIGKEQDTPLGMDKPGLEVWSRCFGDEAAIEKISNFLQTDGKISEEVNDFLKASSPQEIYEQLIEPIAWETDSKSISYVEQSIREHLIHHGDRYSISPPDAEKVVASLITEAWRAASDEENCELTRKRFLEIFAENTRVSVPMQDTQNQQPINLKILLDSIKEALLGDLPDINIAFQSKFYTQNTVPPLLPDAISRGELLTSIQTKLQSDGIAIIQGGTGRGKTTLANLTTKTIDGSWSWWNFTNKDSSQIIQHLQQLANAVSNQPVQVNVVLDDLNLQYQELRTYEEILGTVIYRVLERGAKLLITSQRKPPPNLIRSLGVSSSVTINVPNFTEPEIRLFAEQMGCPTNELKTCVISIQTHTLGHPKLVHARLAQLREKNWKEKYTIESLLQTPQEVKDEREAARQLVSKLPEDQQKFLYRLSLMHTIFRRDYALNIGEIPEPVQNPGIVLDQLDGPWIDRVNETYFIISPLLIDAAKQVWSKNVTNKLHTQIANAILEADHLTTIEARAVFHHSIQGKNKKGLISVIYSLITAPEEDWQNICQEFSWIRYLKTNPPDEFFPGDFFENHMFRSLQYRFSVEVEPEFASKILEIWDNETKKYKTHQSYLMARLMLTTQALRYNQATLPAKKLVGYLKEIIDIKNMDKKVWKSYFNSMEELKETNIDESNFFSFLFSCIYMRSEINTAFLNELIDTLDKLDPRIRTLLLVDFENVYCHRKFRPLSNIRLCYNDNLYLKGHLPPFFFEGLW